MTYTEHCGTDWYTYDSSYEVAFQFTVENDSLQGIATATQAVTIVPGDDSWIENENVPPTLNLVVWGYIYDDETVDIHFGRNNEAPFPKLFTFDYFAQIGSTIVSHYDEGDDLLSIYGYSHHFVPPFTLRAGTQSGSYTYAHSDNSYSFTITFVPAD
jgi:hypothetical protein